MQGESLDGGQQALFVCVLLDDNLPLGLHLADGSLT